MRITLASALLWPSCLVFCFLLVNFIGVQALSVEDSAISLKHESTSSSRWNGDWFPNAVLTNQDGKKLRFYDDMIKGKIVVINFIFTSCPQVCPMETAKLVQVQKELGDSLGREIFMYSISIDPETDTAPVLKKYMEKFRIGPGWQFFTGNTDEINTLRKKLGLLGAKSEKEPLNLHSLSFIIGNEATGHWMKRSAMDHPKVIARILKDDLQNFRNPPSSAADYQEAPKLATFSEGEKIFRTRCLTCHSIGGTDQIGPDLLGITDKRENKWLVRWLMVPDKMLAEKDPIAMDLYKRYKEIAMPNLDLTEQDAKSVLEYIKTESEKAPKAVN